MLFTLFTILLLAFSTSTTASRIRNAIRDSSSTTSECCLTDAEANYIISIWDPLFTSNISHVAEIITPNFTYFDLDYTNGKNVPLTTGIGEFKSYLLDLNDPKKSETIETDEIPIVVFHGCDWIALRWEAVARTTGLREKETGVKAGKKFTFRGIDLLHVDLKTKKVYEAATSEDNLTLNTELGYKLVPAKAKCLNN